MHLHIDHQNPTSTIIGACCGFVKGVTVQVQLQSSITFGDIIETVVFAAIGAVVGLIVQAIWQAIKKKFFNH